MVDLGSSVQVVNILTINPRGRSHCPVRVPVPAAPLLALGEPSAQLASKRALYSLATLHTLTETLITIRRSKLVSTNLYPRKAQANKPLLTRPAPSMHEPPSPKTIFSPGRHSQPTLPVSFPFFFHMNVSSIIINPLSLSPAIQSFPSIFGRSPPLTYPAPSLTPPRGWECRRSSTAPQECLGIQKSAQSKLRSQGNGPNSPQTVSNRGYSFSSPLAFRKLCTSCAVDIPCSICPFNSVL